MSTGEGKGGVRESQADFVLSAELGARSGTQSQDPEIIT